MFNNMKIGTRLYLNFILILSFIALIAFFSMNLSDINNKSTDISQIKLQRIFWSNKIIDNINVNSVLNGNKLLYNIDTEADKIEEAHQLVLKLRAENDGLIDSLEQNLQSADGKKLMSNYRKVYNKYVDDANKYRAMIVDKADHQQLTNFLLNEYRVAEANYKNATFDLINHQNDIVQAEAHQIVAEIDNLIQISVIASIIIAILSVIITIITRSSIVKPINMAVEFADNIARGKVNIDSINNTSNDETGQLLRSMDQMAGTIRNVINEMLHTTNLQTKGDIEAFADENKFSGAYKELIVGFNKGMQIHIDNLLNAINIITDYSDGDFANNMPVLPGKQIILTEAVNKLKQNILNLLSDANMLSNAALAGKLNVRADESKHHGEYQTIIVGINNTLDAVINPLNLISDIFARISLGDIPEKISAVYQGRFEEIKGDVNRCIDAINLILNDINGLGEYIQKGQLSQRGDTSKHSGDFAKIMGAVNNTLDSVINPLQLIADILSKVSMGNIPQRVYAEYEGEFEDIKDSVNRCIDAITLLLYEINELGESVQKGRLDVRGDTSMHNGDFAKIMGAVNNTLDSVINPLNLISEMFHRISNGDIPNEITTEYQGEFDNIKRTVNRCIYAINMLIEDTTVLAKAVENGQLDTRTDLERHRGDFRKIIQGVNQAIDLVAIPTNEISSTMAIFTTGDLTARIVNSYNGDFAKLKEDINQFANTLGNLILEITETVQNTASAALQISSTAESLAAASQEQSAQADEVANAVEAMSRTITENAMSASRTAEVATHNSHIARESGKVVEQTVIKMKDIAVVVKNSAKNIEQLGESSKEIGEIISVIDDIADQTNLLALNAAIEAARAGEQGRGFAVVADEVRKLAERTTDATKQIANMIKGIQNETQQAVVAMNQGTTEVQSGIELADKAGDSLKQILHSTEEVLDMVNQIASASEEQSATSEEISKNVIAISRVTNDATIRIEDVAKTSDDLAHLTEQLRTLVMTFKISDSHYSRTANILNDVRERRQLTSSDY